MLKNNKKTKKEKYLNFAWFFTKGVRHLLLIKTLFVMLISTGAFIMIHATINLVDVTLGGVEGSIGYSAILIAIGVSFICIGIYVRDYVGHIVFIRMQVSLREYILRKFFSRKYKDMQNKHSAELMTLTTDDTQKTISLFDFLSESFVWNTLMVLGSVIMMFFINWQLSAIIAATLPIAYLIMNGFAPVIERRAKELTKAEESVRKNMHEGFSKAFLFRAFFMIDKLAAKHRSLNIIKEKASIKRAKVGAYHAQVNNVYNELLTFTVYALGGFFVMREMLTVGEVLAIMALRGNLYRPVLSLNQYITLFSEAKAGVSRIISVTHLPDETSYPNTPINKVSKLAIEDVSFSYQDEYNNDDAVLRDVSLSFLPGKITAITGESGSGKSTLSKIIMGFYTPHKGTVKLKDTEDCFTQNILPHVAYVPPTDYVFSGSITENICMTHDVNESTMKKAAIAAGIHEFITTLPEGYDTIIGEGATELSSGQGQRVAIARALYQDSPVIIFDEPTSNLDKDSIVILHKEIKRLSQSKICIVITHDKATMDICDEVYVVEDKGVHLS
ncbi:MAG: ABC transporter ATP-binding protein/permease [Defluviitaleaceae bacterium]|nr:ABC transporter ATP-binding protein/permease [Defluviitaleaceae bacterium]